MNKIILALIFVTGSLFAQTGASFKFGDMSTWWIPKFKPFGTSTTFTDSTNYMTLFGKGLYVFDSIKTDKDLIVKGAVVLDTNRLGKLQYIGYNIYLNNDKAGGNMTFQLMDAELGSAGDFTWLFGNYLSGVTAMTLDSTSGLTVSSGNIQLSGGTQQIKLPSDTASDYDANDAITLNRQSGVITTKSLTTATDNFYTFTLTNSLISATSKVFLSYCGGTESAGRPMVYRVVSGSGSATCIILNLAGAGSFNGNIKFNFVVFN